MVCFGKWLWHKGYCATLLDTGIWYHPPQKKPRDPKVWENWQKIDVHPYWDGHIQAVCLDYYPKKSGMGDKK